MKTRRGILAGAPVLAALAAAQTMAQEPGVGRTLGGPCGPVPPRAGCAPEGLGGLWTPEHFDAVGDGEADDADAIEAWLRAGIGPKVAPPGKTYRMDRAIDLTDADPFDADFSGSTLKLAHTEPLGEDAVTVYGLRLPARHALRNVTIEGLGDAAMQSGIITPRDEDGGIIWENVWFRNLQRRAFHVRSDNFTGQGTIRITDCQTFPGDLPDGYDQGAGRFNCRNFTIQKLWGEGGSKRCFAFADADFRGERQAIECGTVGHVYVPNWETLGYSGQALYLNFANNVTFGRIDVLDYHCDVSSIAVYFSRDCHDITVLSAFVSARGHPLTTALNIGGGRRIAVRDAYLKAEGRVLRIEGHRNNFIADDITVEGVFHCHIPDGVTLVEPPVLLRSNRLESGPDRDLRSATIRGKLVLTGKGTIVGTDDTETNSARGCFLMVDSCTGTVLLDAIEMDTGARRDVIPIGVGSTGAVAQVIVRDMAVRTSGRAALAAWKGDVRVQGGLIEQVAPEDADIRSAVWTPADTEAVYRIRGLDAGPSDITLENGARHLVTGCIAANVTVPEDGLALNNASLG